MPGGLTCLQDLQRFPSLAGSMPGNPVDLVFVSDVALLHFDRSALALSAILPINRWNLSRDRWPKNSPPLRSSDFQPDAYAMPAEAPSSL